MTKTKLYLAMELSDNTWKLGFAIENSKPKVIDAPARDWSAFEATIKKATAHFQLVDPEIHSCYEAGRDGFWIHRGLQERNISNQIIDSSSIEVSRRKRVAKTDGLDVRSMLNLLRRYHAGDQKAYRVVTIPSPGDDDDRHLHRGLQAFKKERTMLSNRIKGLLISHGAKPDSIAGLAKRLDSMQDGNGQPLRPQLILRLQLDCARYDLVDEQIRKCEAIQDELVRTPASQKTQKVKTLTLLRGIGNRSSWILVMEAFGWRHFANRKQAGAFPGFAPVPWASGKLSRDQGISKAGNARIRWLMVEIAWLWIRWQPGSALTQWYETKTRSGSKRIKRIAIVALARKLFIALWRFLETGVAPTGAILKMA